MSGTAAVPPALELRCFGPPTLRVDGPEPGPDDFWRKHLAFLTYLALSPDCTRSREQDDLLMWPRPAATMDSPLPFSVPDLARLAIVGRVGNLDEESGQVLRAASIGSGRGLDIELIGELVDRPVDRVEHLLNRLEQLHFVRHDGQRYAFAAQMMASVLRVEILAKVERGEQTLREALEVARAAIEAGSSRTVRRVLLAADRVARDERSRGQVAKLRAQLEA